jgi:putative ABC transport system permease protein
MTSLSWPAAWRIARRDLSLRFKGLRLLIVCLFLGVGALAAIGSLTGALEKGLATEGRQLLGGDVEVSVWQRPLSDAEAAILAPYGTLSRGTRMQAMLAASPVTGSTTAPVEIKAVDDNWPMVGRLTLADGRRVGPPPPGQAWLAEGAAVRLGVKAGDRVTLSGQPLVVGGIIADEPDRLSEGFALGPTVIVRADVPAQAGLTAPGAMYRSKTRLACARPCDAQAIADTLKARFPSAGLELRTRDRAAPGAENFVARMGDFLVLVGLAALLIAGIGIGGGTASWAEARRNAIATLKVLGATSGDIARITVLQIGAAALAGSLAGVLAGLALLPLLSHLVGNLLPIATTASPQPLALLRAAAYGLLVALVFAAPPLAQARRFPAMALLRARVSASPMSGGRDALLPAALGLAAILALALLSSPSPRLVLLFLAGAAALFGTLALVGLVIRRIAMRLPRARNPLVRIALANLHRPGAQTGRLVVALGFGLSAFVLLAVVQTSLDANIAARVPARAPDWFVLDLPPARLPEFTRTVSAQAPTARIRTVPMLRGAILAYGPADHMTRVADLAEIPDDAWALKGERGLTYSAPIPEGNVVTQGNWWPADYAGPPLVSVDEKLARTIGLHLGDQVTIGLLGVERTMTVASFRRIDWDSFGFNYVLVFSPNALADAPHQFGATISLPGAQRTPEVRANLLRALTRQFPASSVIEVGNVLKDARALLDQMATAILAAASVAVLAGVAVLLGALAAVRASRLYDNVILRVLGAGRRQLLVLQLVEFGTLALVLALLALGLGSALGWLVIVKQFDFEFLPDWPRVLAVLALGLALVMAFALGGALPWLRARPAEALREL